MTPITISLEKEMLSAIDGLVEEKGLGFESREEFIREGIRMMMVKYGC